MKKKSYTTFIPLGSSDINCCRNPFCDNFLEPSEYPDFIIGPNKKNPNKKYSRIGNSHGVQLRCNACNETFPIKNQPSLTDEYDRIQKPKFKPSIDSCPDESCDNHRITVGFGKEFYSKFGKNSAGAPRFKCKCCNKTFSVNHKPHKRQFKPHLNKIIFNLLVNKSPLSCIAAVTDISMSTVYDKIDFIYEQCAKFAYVKEQHLNDVLSGKRLKVSSDCQFHLVNWVHRKDKRNTQLQSVATACNETSYVFGIHANYDSEFNQGDIESLVMKYDEETVEPAFRQTARFWTVNDYLKAISRSVKQRKLPNNYAIDSTDGEILNKYLESNDRSNIDDSFQMDKFLKTPDRGAQIHSEYTLLAHFKLMSEKFLHAKKVNHYMDQESGLRAGFMLAYRDDLKDKSQKRVDGFYIKFRKGITVDEKRRIFNARQTEINSVMNEHGIEALDAIFTLLNHEIENAAELGRWKDRWVSHPVPTMSEPDRMVCHLNNLNQHSLHGALWIHYYASLSGVDRFFQQLRRKVSLLERPIHSQTNEGNNWNGYNPYNPEMVVKLIEIYRVYYNFCKAGEDKKTPAQRIGLSKGLNKLEEILYFQG